MCAICNREPCRDGCARFDLLAPAVSEAPRAIPRTRVCEGCGENLSTSPHGPRCPTLVRVTRLATDHEGRRMEDALEAANIAGQAWLRARARRAA
jgi:hypothetical protein